MIETNEPAAAEIKRAVDELGRAFEEFKAANDHAHRPRNEGRADIVLEERIGRIGAEVSLLAKTLDRHVLAERRPGFGGHGAEDPAAAEHKAAFLDRFVRKGVDAGLEALEAKALSAGSGADGGYAVPEELDRSIERLLIEASPIRAIASVVAIGSANYKKLVNLGGAVSGWVGESDARAATETPDFAEVAPPLGEIYANPAATQTMLDDAFFNVEDWLAGELASEFAFQEAAAFVTGNGTNRPKGFLSYPTAATADGARAFGTLEHLATGVSGGWPASNPADILVDLVHRLRAGYRQNATFVMSTGVLAEIRKFKDADGNYLWRPGLAEGRQSTLLGYPVVEAEDMPDRAAGALSVAFGDFARGYVVTDRVGTRILRDPFTNKPFVHFYATKRVGGGVVNSEAIKLLKFATA